MELSLGITMAKHRNTECGRKVLWPLSGPNRRELHLAIGSPSRLPQGVRKFRQTNMCNGDMENP